MPIQGLTSREAGFPRLGKIFKGAPKEGNRPGSDLDYFRLESDRANLKQEFLQLVGPQPKELEVLMPYPTVEECFDPWMREYGTSGLKRKCDGVTQVLHLPEGSSAYSEEPIPCLQQTQGGCKCTRSTGLKVIIRDLFALGHCGYFDMMTSSKHDIVHIQSVLNTAFQFKGSLLGIPFKLRRVPQDKSFPMKDKRGMKTYELIQLEIDPAWVQKQFADQYAAMMGIPQAPAIAATPRTFASVTAKLEAGRAMPALKPTGSEVLKRVAALAKLTLHDAANLRSLCAGNDLPTESLALSDGQCMRLMEIMLVDRFDMSIEGIDELVANWMAEGKPEAEIFAELKTVEDSDDE